MKYNYLKKLSLQTTSFEKIAFFIVFAIVFSSFRIYSSPFSNGNVEQWVNLTNQMFYGSQDFLFSYGPLYWITGGTATQYNAYTYWISVCFVSLINAAFWSLTIKSIDRANAYPYLFLTYFLFVGTVVFPPAVYLLPFVIIAYLDYRAPNGSALNVGIALALGILVAFLSYIRFFYGVVGLATISAYLVSRIFSDRKFAILLSFIASAIVGYVAFGMLIFKSHESVLNYLLVNKNLSFGNSVDMTIDVINSTETFIAVTIIFILFNLFSITYRPALLLSINALLLLFFKLGFSRTDHYIVYFVIPIAALSLVMVFHRTKLAKFLFLICTGCIYYISVNPSYPGAPTKEPHLSKINFDDSYADRMQKLYENFKLDGSLLQEIGTDTIDIYPYNNEYAFANNLNYKHRPSFQNYMTLTPVLDTLNKEFFESTERPDFLLITPGIACVSPECNIFDAFDQKLSLNEDPLTFSSMLLNYHLVGTSKGKDGVQVGLYKQNEHRIAYAESHMLTQRMKFDTWYPVPESDDLVKLKPNFEITNYGRMKNLFFRGEVLKVRYKLFNGEIREYRLNILNSTNGVWISPLIDNLSLSGDKVESIMFTTNSENYFQNEFESSWVTLDIPQVKTRTSHSYLDVSELSEYSSVHNLVCFGSLDSINQMILTKNPLHLKSTQLFNVEGWLALGAEDERLFDSTLITFTDTQGKKTSITAQRRKREELAVGFKNKYLTDSGFRSSIDLSSFDGDYLVGLAGVLDDNLYNCAQYAIRVKVEK